VGSYVENAFMVAATNPQTGLNVDCSQNTIKLINNVIRIVKFPNTYKQRPGHGGLWKTPALPNSPKRVMKGNSVYFGPIVGNNQEILPPASLFASPSDCDNNTFYFAGDATQWNTWLADSDGINAQTNAERLADLAYCVTVVKRTDLGLTESQFLSTVWADVAFDWIFTHGDEVACE